MATSERYAPIFFDVVGDVDGRDASLAELALDLEQPREGRLDPPEGLAHGGEEAGVTGGSLGPKASEGTFISTADIRDTQVPRG